MKKRTSIFSVILACVLPMLFTLDAKDQSVPAQSAHPLDGSVWNGLGDGAHAFFMVGFQRGFEQGQAVMVRATATKSKLDALLSARDKLYMGGPTKGQEMAHGAVLDETTLFYKDFRNTQVCWEDAMQIAQLTLEGAAPSESELEAIRSEDAKEGCAH
jgi:hypothetical protein